MQNFEYKKLVLEVDMATSKKRVRQLPLSGDIDKLFQEKVLNKSANLGLTVKCTR